jgi:hypothetical protein
VTFLSNLAVDPKALTARMRVGAPEPAELRKAVAKLDQQEQGLCKPAEEVAELQKRIVYQSNVGALGQLTRREMREGCKVVLHPPTPLAASPEVIDGLLHQVEHNKRRAAFFAVIDAYLDGFERDDPSVLSLAEKLRAMATRWAWRPNDHWPARLSEFSLLDPTRAPELIARRVLTSGKRPREVLAEAGLETGSRRFGALVEAAFRFACHLVMGRQGQEAVDGQRTLIDWARDDAGRFGYQRSWPDFVKASLLPWELVEPSETHKSALIEMLESFGGGDPRAHPQRWREVMDNAPGAYAVLMRWLTRASVLQFLDVVDRLMPDHQAKQMWAYRRAFWTSYLLSDGSSAGIDAAWVAFGDEGARLANRAAQESGDKSFSAFGKQNDKSAVHAALILQMGDLTIVDWSHNAKYQVWKRGDKGMPELFKASYRHGALYNAPIDGSHVSPATYSWQKRLARIIEGRPFYSPKPAWRPRRV